MKKISKEDIKQEVFDLYDDYAHNRLNRRQFIDKLSAYAVGGLTVASMMSFIMPNYQDKIQIPENDFIDNLFVENLPLNRLRSFEYFFDNCRIAWIWQFRLWRVDSEIEKGSTIQIGIPYAGF